MPFEALYLKIRLGILPKLEKGLSPDLSYHSVNHTLDVEAEAERIAVAAGIAKPEDLFLLKTACLYHDSGFMFTYQEHEVAGCTLARDELPAFGLNGGQIERICGMIMATKIPQTPHNVLEEIICDADLDYLGREDFFTIGETLFSEWKARKFINTVEEWNKIQFNFLKRHHYFTERSKILRGPQKLRHLQMVESSLSRK